MSKLPTPGTIFSSATDPGARIKIESVTPCGEDFIVATADPDDAGSNAKGIELTGEEWYALTTELRLEEVPA